MPFYVIIILFNWLIVESFNVRDIFIHNVDVKYESID